MFFIALISGYPRQKSISAIFEDIVKIEEPVRSRC